VRVVSAALLGALVALVAYGAYRAGARESARLAYERHTDTLRVEIVRLDTVYARDTLTFWRLKRVVDTLVVPESIPVIARDSARAETALRQTTEALTACALVVQTCEQRVAAERRLREAAEAAVAAGLAPAPHRPGRAFGVGVLAGVAGTAAAALYHRHSNTHKQPEEKKRAEYTGLPEEREKKRTHRIHVCLS
jgi:hypothetical protein